MCSPRGLGRILFLTMAAFATSAMSSNRAWALTIVVGGHNSENDPNPGIFITGKLIDPQAVTFRLSEGAPDGFQYAHVEQAAYELARASIHQRETVVLLGYSHGATLMLRVAHMLYELSQNSRSGEYPLKLIKLILVDGVSRFYPLSPIYNSAPPGFGSTFNIFQHTGVFHGNRLNGATNRDATLEINLEYTQGSLVSPTDPRFGGGLEGYHVFMQSSDHVRRSILRRFNVNYLPGLWQVRQQVLINGDTPREDARYFMLYVQTSGNRFEAKSFADGRYFRFTGTINGRMVKGDLTIPLDNPAECPNLGESMANGTSRGSISESYNEINLTLQGKWPGYNPLTCRWLGLFSFNGKARGILGHATAAANRELENRSVGEIENRPTPLSRKPSVYATPMPANLLRR